MQVLQTEGVRVDKTELPLLQVTGLCRAFGGVQAVDQVQGADGVQAQLDQLAFQWVRAVGVRVSAHAHDVAHAEVEGHLQLLR